jgi:hypothetical protein
MTHHGGHKHWRNFPLPRAQAYEQTGGKATRAKIVINSDARPAPAEGDAVMSSHKRRYNAPETYRGRLFGPQRYGEVSVLMPDADTQGRDLVVQLRGGGLQYIHETHRAVDALHFVLLFPKGDDGWQIGQQKDGSRQQISPCDYYAYRMQWRVDDDGGNSLLMSSRLFQEYSCSAFAKAELQRLRWQRNNQYRRPFARLFIRTWWTTSTLEMVGNRSGSAWCLPAALPAALAT